MSASLHQQTRDVIVVGASMGGIQALSCLAAQLSDELPAALFVVQHTAPEAPGYLAEMLDQRSSLSVVLAEHGMPIERGRIYVAPPDYHLLVGEGRVQLSHGPRENRCRPSIDPLFRSAAVTYRSRVIGVILTGYLNDGAAGLLAVKRCGGLAVVQSPTDAAYPDMPEAALAVADVDHQVPLAKMGSLLGELTRMPAPTPPDIPTYLVLENRVTARAMTNAEATDLPGRPSMLSCPECGGPLWELEDEPLRRYRCHVGHAFTGRALLEDQHHATEEALYVAMRTLKERANLLERLARDERRAGRERAAITYEERARESQGHARQIQTLLQEAPETGAD